MSGHTRGPWMVECGPALEKGEQRKLYLRSEQGRKPIAVVVIDSHPDGVNAARIVACVNACEGMDDPAVYIETVRRDRQEFMAERDEALDALERAHETYYGNPDQAAFATIEATLLKHGRLK